MPMEIMPIIGKMAVLVLLMLIMMNMERMTSTKKEYSSFLR